MSIANRLKIDIFLLSGLRFVSSYAVPRLYTAQHSTALPQHSTVQYSTSLDCVRYSYLKNTNRTSTFRAKAFRREVSGGGWENYMSFYTIEYKSDHVTKADIDGTCCRFPYISRHLNLN
jgi:hypothetical protein